MSEWKKVRLGDISIDGGHYGIGAAAVEYDESLPTYLRITDIREDGTIIRESLKSVDDPDACEYYLKPNDLVIARTGASTGRNYFYDGRDGQLVYAGFLIRFSIDERKIWPPYVKYWFQGSEYRTWLLNHTDGSTRANINAVTLGDCPIYCPTDVSTQRKIAAVLSSLDDKIENNRKICANLEAQAQAIFKSWFVDEYSQEIPLARVCTKISDGVHNTVSDEPGSRFMLLSCKNIINGVVDFSQGYRTIHQNTFQELRSRTQLEYGDVLVGSVGTIGEIALVNDNAEDYEFQRSVAILKPNKELISSAYLYYALNAYKKKLINVAHGAVQQCIFLGDFREFAIPFGSRRRIIQFDELVMPLMREKYSLVKQTDSLAALRDALLPKLMSGEIDVEKVEVA